MKPSIPLISILLPFASSAIADTFQLNNATIAVDNPTNQTLAFPPLSAGYYYEHQVISHLASRLKTCIGQIPSDHGLFFHIEDRSEEPDSYYVEQQQQDLSKRGYPGSIHKGWKAMPFDQRLGVISTVAGTAAVPMYLMGAGIGFNEYEIGNFKESLVSKSGNQTRHRGQTYALPPPPTVSVPPPIRAGHRKRSWTETVQDYMPLLKRSPAVEHAAKVPKVRNEEVDRIIGMIGAGNAILYLSTAAVGAVKVMTVRQGDTTAYKRALLPEMKGYTVSCIPVQKLSDMDYQIPKGGLFDGIQETDGTKRLEHVNPAAVISNDGKVDSFAEGKSADLSNGHHRVLVKRAVIPVSGDESIVHDNVLNKKTLSDASLLKSSAQPSPHAHKALKIDAERPFVRRDGKPKPHNHPEGHPANHPAGEGGHPEGHHDADGPVYVEKIKHVYHVDPNAAKGGHHAPALLVKQKSNKGKIAAFVAGGAALGYTGHMMYQSNLQQQQATAAAAQLQAQAYGDDESSYPMEAPATKRGQDWIDDYMVRRSFSKEEDVASSLFRRGPGGGPKGEPAVVFIKHEVHHHNVHPDHVPGGAYHHQGHHEPGGAYHNQGHHEDGRGGPSSKNGQPSQGSGGGGMPDSSTGHEKKHEKDKDGEVEGAPEKKKMSTLSKVGMVAGGAAAGAYLHAYMSPAAPPPAMQQGYYDDGTGATQEGQYYKKRDLPSSMKKRSQVPLFVNRGFSGEPGTVKFAPDYLDYYNHLSKRGLTKRNSYGEYIQALKKAADEEARGGKSALKKVIDDEGKTINTLNTAATLPAKRDKIQYDFDGQHVHFTTESANNPARVIPADEKEEAVQRREVSDISFDTDEKTGGVHFHAGENSKTRSTSTGKATVANGVGDLGLEDGLERRAAPVSITYEKNADNSQYFNANTTGKKEEEEEEEDSSDLRRRELANIQFDHSKTGSHFAATMKNTEKKTEEEEEPSTNLKELESLLQRRDHHDIDYKTNKDNETFFHASSPYIPSKGNDNADQNKEKGITIHIVPRSGNDADSTFKMVRRNRIVADR